MFKNAPIIFISLIFLMESMLPCTELCEIAKMPELLQHYQNHKLRSPDLSFVDFLDLHYGDSKHYDDEPVSHEKLPFSKGRHHAVTFQLTSQQATVDFSFQYTFVMTIEKVVYVEPHPFTLPPAIWQPPRA